MTLTHLFIYLAGIFPVIGAVYWPLKRWSVDTEDNQLCACFMGVLWPIMVPLMLFIGVCIGLPMLVSYLLRQLLFNRVDKR